MENKKVPRRSRVKHPALKPNYNLKHRQDYLDVGYVNGVHNKQGEKVIRSLTEEEKDWLNKFNEETISGSFKDDGTDFYKLDKEQQEIWNTDYSRRHCIFNYLKMGKRLDEFNPDKYDEYVAKQISSIDHEMILIDDMENRRLMQQKYKRKKRFRLLITKEPSNKLDESVKTTGDTASDSPDNSNQSEPTL